MNNPWVDYYNQRTPDDLEKFLDGVEQCDLVAVSAGFDGHVEDWGGLFVTGDYYEIGRMIGSFAGRVFAPLEGGYKHSMLGQTALALLKGLEEGTSVPPPIKPWTTVNRRFMVILRHAA